MRYETYMRKLDLTKRILEIGPLNAPILSKQEAPFVYYADILPTEAVKDFYARCANISSETVCDIDFVITTNYTQTFKDVEKFDYVVSSHVLEHMPRLIEFFQDIQGVLRQGGELVVFLPDSRYCFDHFRSPTSFAELYYIHTQGLPFAPWQVLDSTMAVELNDPAHYHLGSNMYPLLSTRKNFEASLQLFNQSLAGEYIPTHYSVFTPLSFLLLMHDMLRAHLIGFRVLEYFPTPKHDFTFGARLELAPELMQSESLREEEMRKIRKIMATIEDIENR